MTAVHNESTEILIQEYLSHFPQEAVRLLETHSISDLAGFLERTQPTLAARAFELLHPEIAVQCISALSEDALAGVLSCADPMRTAPLVARLGQAHRDRILQFAPAPIAEEIRELIQYPEGTAGAMMDPRYTSFRGEMTTSEWMSQLESIRNKKVRDLLLVDAEGRFLGSVPLHDAILADPSRSLEDLVSGSTPSIHGMASQEEVMERLSVSKIPGLPVVDSENRLIGMIRQPSVVQAAHEEALSDIQAMVGVSREERALSPSLFAVRRRLPWLQINLMTAFLAAAVVGLFEETIATITALAVLLPVVAGQSGNTGAQALAVTMRGLALREVRVRHWFRIMSKEAAAGFLNGLAVAVVTMLGVYLWSHSFGLCAVMGISMVLSMTLAGIAGTAVPMLLTAWKQDPAQSSSIILTTVTDVVGFMTFLGLATLMSGSLTSG